MTENNLSYRTRARNRRFVVWIGIAAIVFTVAAIVLPPVNEQLASVIVPVALVVSIGIAFTWAFESLQDRYQDKKEAYGQKSYINRMIAVSGVVVDGVLIALYLLVPSLGNMPLLTAIVLTGVVVALLLYYVFEDFAERKLRKPVEGYVADAIDRAGFVPKKRLTRAEDAQKAAEKARFDEGAKLLAVQEELAVAQTLDHAIQQVVEYLNGLGERDKVQRDLHIAILDKGYAKPGRDTVFVNLRAPLPTAVIAALQNAGCVVTDGQLTEDQIKTLLETHPEVPAYIGRGSLERLSAGSLEVEPAPADLDLPDWLAELDQAPIVTADGNEETHPITAVTAQDQGEDLAEQVIIFDDRPEDAPQTAQASVRPEPRRETRPQPRKGEGSKRVRTFFALLFIVAGVISLLGIGVINQMSIVGGGLGVIFLIAAYLVRPRADRSKPVDQRGGCLRGLAYGIVTIFVLVALAGVLMIIDQNVRNDVDGLFATARVAIEDVVEQVPTIAAPIAAPTQVIAPTQAPQVLLTATLPPPTLVPTLAPTTNPFCVVDPGICG